MRLIFPGILLTLAVASVAANAQSNESEPRTVAVNGPVGMRPWVGISVSPAPVELRTQLKVADGVGLVVQFVQSGSPAADAGLKPFDLLLKLDDQWLVNPEQFSVLVRMHHSGDQVKLTFLREAREQTVSVKLVEHEFIRPPDDWGDRAGWPGLSRPDAVRGLAPGHAARERVLTWVDGNRQISVTTADNHTVLTVRDGQADRILFDGPIDTEEQRKKLPPDIRGVLDSLSKVSAAFDGSADKQPTSQDPHHEEHAAPVKP